MNRQNVLLAILGITTPIMGATVVHASDIEDNIIRLVNGENNWTITSSDLDSNQDTITKLTSNGNPIVFNKSNNSVGNVDPITGLSSVSFISSNSVIKISTGFKEDKFLYERYIENDGSNEFSVSLFGERYINLSSLNEELAIDEVNIEYSCSGNEEEIYDSNLLIQYNSKTESYSVGAVSTPIAKKMKTVLIPRYYDDGVNGEHDVTIVRESGFNACNATSIYIPSTITKIENQGFYQNFNVPRIYLPDSVLSIGGSAFNKNTKLTHIRLSENLTSIGMDCFKEDELLEEIYLPDSITKIESSTFTKCYALNKVNCPKGVKALPNSMFYFTHAMTEFFITKNVKDVGYHSFRNCNNIENVSYEGTVTEYSKLDNAKRILDACPKLTVIHCLDGDFTL